MLICLQPGMDELQFEEMYEQKRKEVNKAAEKFEKQLKAAKKSGSKANTDKVCLHSHIISVVSHEAHPCIAPFQRQPSCPWVLGLNCRRMPAMALPLPTWSDRVNSSSWTHSQAIAISNIPSHARFFLLLLSVALSAAGGEECQADAGQEGQQGWRVCG